MANVVAHTTCILHETILFSINNLVGLQLNSSDWSLLGIDERLPGYGDLTPLLLAIFNVVEWSRDDHTSLVELVKKITDLAFEAADVIADYTIWSYDNRHSSHKPTTMPNVYGTADEILGRKDEIIKEKKKLETQAEYALSEFAVEGKSWRRCITPPYAVGDQARILVELRLCGGGFRRDIVCISQPSGPSKIAKRIYTDLFIECRFKQRAWVSFTRASTSMGHVGVVRVLLKCLIKFTDEMVVMDLKDLLIMLHDQLQGAKYLIVFEDVQDRSDWDIFWGLTGKYLPDDSNGSRILITAPRDSEVPLLDQRKHVLYRFFNEEKCEVSRRNAVICEICSQQWEDLGRRVAGKCGELSLSLQCQDCAQHWKDLERQVPEMRWGRPLRFEYCSQKWAHLGSKVGCLLIEKREKLDELASGGCSSLPKHLDEHNEILALYFVQLPYYMKPCLLYFSVFPENCEIPARQVIHMWIAEHLVRETFRETMEEVAERYLELLVDLHYIQVVNKRLNGRVKTCRMHRLIRDFCIHEAERVKFIEFHGFMNSLPLINPRRLVGNANTIEYLFQNVHSVRKLQSLLCFTPMSHPSEVWSHILGNMTLLKVLKVSDVDGVPNEVDNLLLLKYLAVDSKSLQIPSTIFNLLNLQTLDARSEYIRCAPAGIWKLKKLRHLYFQGPAILPQPPACSSSSDENSSLQELQTLSTISPSSCTPQVFQKLPNLLKLGVKGDLSDLSSNWVMLGRLGTLKLARAADSPPVKSLPRQFPPSLTNLTLRDTLLKEDPMQLLGDIKKLRMLKLSNNAYVGKKMLCSAYEFSQLQILKLVVMEHIRELTITNTALPNLNSLFIHDCPDLDNVHGLLHATTLKVIDLRYPSTDLRLQMTEYNKTDHYQLHIYPLQEDEDE